MRALRFRLGMGALTAAAFFGATGGVAHAGLEPAETSLEIETYDYDGSGTVYEREQFQGRISSVDANCAKDRAIAVFRKRPGNDQPVDASLFFETSGTRWFAEVPEERVGKRELGDGSYYATVPFEAVNGSPCDASKSKLFEVKTPRIDVRLDYFGFTVGSGEYQERVGGDLVGGEAKCLGRRKVTLFRKRKASDEKIATTRSATPSGTTLPEFEFETQDLDLKQGLVKVGVYYASLSAAKGCKEVRSNNQRVEPRTTSNEMGFYFFPGSPRRGSTPDNEFFEGFIGSDAGPCHVDRGVTIYRRLAGEDEVVATVRTVPLNASLSRYFYRVPDETALEPDIGSGTFYSVTEKRKGCETATSQDVIVQYRRAAAGG